MAAENFSGESDGVGAATGHFGIFFGTAAQVSADGHWQLTALPGVSANTSNGLGQPVLQLAASPTANGSFTQVTGHSTLQNGWTLDDLRHLWRFLTQYVG